MEPGIQCVNPRASAMDQHGKAPGGGQVTVLDQTGTAAAATVTPTLANLVVRILGTSNGTEDYLKYDPDGDESLSRPTVSFALDRANDEPLTVVVVLVPTAVQGTTPLVASQGPPRQEGVCYFETTLAPGEHTLTWDGRVTPADDPDTAPWGTYAVDVYAFASDGDWTSARLPYDLTAGTHAATFAGPDNARELRFDYTLESATNTAAASLQLTVLNGELEEVDGQAGDTAIGVSHTGVGDAGVLVHTLTADEVECPPWRVVLTGVAGTGAERRRDRCAPRMLAANGKAGATGRYDLWVHTGAENNGRDVLTTDQWAYVCTNLSILTPAGKQRAYAVFFEPLDVQSTTLSWVYQTRAEVGWLTQDQQQRAAALHVTTVTNDDDNSAALLRDEPGGCRTRSGSPTNPDQIYMSKDMIWQAGAGKDQTWLAANCVLHEVGHSAGLGHDIDGKPNVMGASISANPAMFGKLWPANAGKSAWGPGFSKVDDEHYRTADAATAANLTKMRAHCGVKPD